MAKKKKDKTKLIHVYLSDYPDSFYQTPEEVKKYIYELKYQLMKDSMPGETEEFMRQLSSSFAAAELGWGRRAMTLKVSAEEAKKYREMKREARENATESAARSAAANRKADPSQTESQSESATEHSVEMHEEIQAADLPEAPRDIETGFPVKGEIVPYASVTERSAADTAIKLQASKIADEMKYKRKIETINPDFLGEEVQHLEVPD